MATPLMTRNIVVLGKTGAGKSSVANNIMTDRGQPPAFKVSSGLASETKKADMTQMEIVHNKTRYNIKMVDTVGFFDTGGKITNKDILDSIKSFFKSKVPEGVSLVIFVFKRGRYTNEEREAFRFIIDNFRKEISAISALVVTCCEELDARGRRGTINDLRTNPETKSMIEFMGKGVFPVGFPPMDDIKPGLRAVYEEDAAADKKQLRELVYNCHEMYLTQEIWQEAFWRRCTIL